MLGANSDIDVFDEFAIGEGGSAFPGAGCRDCGKPVRDQIIPSAPIASPVTPVAPPKIPGGDPIIIKRCPGQARHPITGECFTPRASSRLPPPPPHLTPDLPQRSLVAEIIREPMRPPPPMMAPLGPTRRLPCCQ